MLLLPWNRFLGSLLVLLELLINGWHLEWTRISSNHRGRDIDMYRLMKMLRSFDLKMKSLDGGWCLGYGDGFVFYLVVDRAPVVVVTSSKLIISVGWLFEHLCFFVS